MKLANANSDSFNYLVNNHDDLKSHKIYSRLDVPYVCDWKNNSLVNVIHNHSRDSNFCEREFSIAEQHSVINTEDENQESHSENKKLTCILFTCINIWLCTGQTLRYELWWPLRTCITYSPCKEQLTALIIQISLFC